MHTGRLWAARSPAAAACPLLTRLHNVKVRLTRKLADYIDGVDLSDHQIGDVLDLSQVEASLLLAEQWAAPERRVREEQACALRRRREDRARSGVK